MLSLSKYRITLVVFCLLFLSACSSGSSVRPEHWAQKVAESDIRALYKVDNHLYRSGRPTAYGMQQAEKMGIRYILNVHHYGDDNDEIRGTALQVKQIRIRVTRMTYQEIVQSLRYIMESDKPVLVHCLTGADRTGVIVAAYRMLQGWTKEASVDEMVNGGYHFRQYLFPKLIPLVESIDIGQLKRDVFVQ